MLPSKKIVLAFGTFDKFHPGHAYFLTQAKQYGDYLMVVVARDHNVLQVKGHLPKDNEDLRLKTISAFPAVNQARLGLEDYSKKETIILEVKPQIICLGYDQARHFKSPLPNIVVIRLEAFHPEKYKSSLLT
jgi:cytidyltransferase-like protein